MVWGGMRMYRGIMATQRGLKSEVVDEGFHDVLKDYDASFSGLLHPKPLDP